jgi:nucleoside-diphosphate-sugar epimerase
LAADITGGWNWERTHPFNIGGTYNVFEASKQNDVRRIIFASSGGTMLGYEMENPYTEIVGADYDKIPGTWTMITDDMLFRPIHLGYV